MMLNVKQVNEAAESAMERIKQQKEQMLKALTDRIQVGGIISKLKSDYYLL